MNEHETDEPKAEAPAAVDQAASTDAPAPDSAPAVSTEAETMPPAETVKPTAEANTETDPPAETATAEAPAETAAAEVPAESAAPVNLPPAADTADTAVAEAPAEAPAEAAAEPAADAAPPAEGRAKGGKPPAARGRPRRQLAELVVGEKLKGKVVGLSKFGAFVDIGATTDGLVHLTELPGKRVRSAEEAVQSGQSVEVFVKEVDLDKGRISLSMRDPVANPLNGLSVGDVVTGHVTTVTKYGAFIDIGSDTEGLVHISEMSSGFVSRPEDVVQPGAEVEVRVKEIDNERKRISLSMVGLASDAAAGSEPEQRRGGGGGGGGGGRGRERQEEVYVPEEPAVRMPTVMELALRRAMGEDVDGDDGDTGKGRGDKGKKAAQREMTDVYAKMLADYRDSKGEGS
ncbi:MAG: S1 RNA-binding domain-containing protein [Ardenticatenales bacterium]